MEFVVTERKELLHVFYHDDLDGRAAAWAVKSGVFVKPRLFCGVDNLSCRLVPMTHGVEFDMTGIDPGDQVWIVDYSISPDEMKKLLNITSDVTWIDHHISAIEQYDGFKPELRGVRSTEDAACVLTWKYINWWTQHGEGEPDLEKVDLDRPMPEAIALVGDRDTWAWRFGDRTRFFFSGATSYDTHPGAPFWDAVTCGFAPTPAEVPAVPLGPSLDEVICDGRVIERYKNQFYREYRDEMEFEVEFEGYHCLAMNVANVGSDCFGKFAPDAYDILISFSYNGKFWDVSLYSSKVDVSKIATKHGGGGHKGAAGFQSENLPSFLK